MSTPQHAGGTASPFGPYGEPALLFNFGPSGVGKTLDAIRTFPDGLFLAPPGGLKSSVRTLGFMPRYVPVLTIYDVRNVLKELIAANGSNTFPAVCVDDASIVMANTLIAMEAKGIGKTRSGNIERRLLYLELATEVKAFRYELKQVATMHSILNFHERGPSTDDKGQFHPGGPELGSAGQTKALAYIADLILRGGNEPHRSPWGGGYFLCDVNDAQYVAKDRFDVAPIRGPLNSGELLRAAGYPMARPKGLEWMDDVVEAISQDVEAATARGAVASVGAGAAPVAGNGLGAFGQPSAASTNASTPRFAVYSWWLAKLMNGGKGELLARWACQDGLDRAEIRMVKRAEQMSRLGLARAADGTFTSTRGA